MCPIIYVISMTNTSRKLLSIIVLSILLVGVITTISYFLITYEKEDPGDRSIIIKSDADLISYSFPGNGTPENPFIIEEIKTENVTIEIENTSKYFIIRNCTLRAPACEWDYCYNPAIKLTNIADDTAIIINNTFNGPDYGIEIYRVSSADIIGNTFIDCWRGIDPSNCDKLLVQCNTFIQCNIGIEQAYSSYIDISDNFFIECNFGLCINSYNSLYSNNTFVNCGILILPLDIMYDNNSFENNTINGLKFGAFVSETNLEINKTEYGQIYLLNCTFVNISNQYMKSVSYGISMYLCSDINIFNCTFNMAGIFCDVTSNVNIARSLFTNDVAFLYIWGSDNLEISYNTFINASLYGIYLKYCNSLIHHNSFISNNVHAVDHGDSNIWYDTILLEGNYWDTWNGVGWYNIPGDANSSDQYPLSEPPV